MAGTADMALITVQRFMMTVSITALVIITGPATITAVMMETGMTTAVAMTGATIQVAVMTGAAGNKLVQTVPIRRVLQGHREMTVDHQASPISTFLQSAGQADISAMSNAS